MIPCDGERHERSSNSDALSRAYCEDRPPLRHERDCAILMVMSWGPHDGVANFQNSG